MPHRAGICTIAHQSAGIHECPELAHHGEFSSQGQIDDLCTMRLNEYAIQGDQSLRTNCAASWTQTSTSPDSGTGRDRSSIVKTAAAASIFLACKRWLEFLDSTALPEFP
jgi:hypothetical protein